MRKIFLALAILLNFTICEAYAQSPFSCTQVVLSQKAEAVVSSPVKETPSKENFRLLTLVPF